MKASPFVVVALVFAGLLPFATAQEPIPAAVTPPTVVPPVSLTAPPTAGLANLWEGVNPTTVHVSGDVALGVYSCFGHGGACPPLIGTSGAVNVLTPNFGVTVGASEITSTRSTSSWTYIRR